MSDMRFENQGDEFGRPPQESSGFDLSGMLVGWGLVSSRKEAEYVLIGLGAVALIVAVFFMWPKGGGAPPPPPPNMAPSTGTR